MVGSGRAGGCWPRPTAQAAAVRLFVQCAHGAPAAMSHSARRSWRPWLRSASWWGACRWPSRSPARTPHDLVTIAADIRQGLDVLASTRRDIRAPAQSAGRLRVVMEAPDAGRAAHPGRALRSSAAASTGAAGRVAGPRHAAGGRSLVQRHGERFQLHEVLRQLPRRAGSRPAGRSRRTPATSLTGSRPALWMDERHAFALLADELENVRGLAVGLPAAGHPGAGCSALLGPLPGGAGALRRGFHLI